jgi:hypothetical protein
MSKKKRQGRPIQSYLESARELSKFIPALKKYKRRKTLKPQEKAAITRKEKIVRYTDYLIPVTKKQARELKDHLFQPETIIKTGKRRGQTQRHKGIQAIQLRNTGADTRIISGGKNLLIASNGWLWAYWHIPIPKKNTATPSARELQLVKQYAEDAFTNPESYEIERVIALAEKAFENPETKGVYLWGESGRVGEGFTSLKQFIRWVSSDYSKYKNTDRWVKGIVILVAEADEHIAPSQWAAFGVKKPKRNKRRWRKR